MARLNRAQFRFRKHDSIGAAAAEEDEAFLSECFYDSGDLEALLDCDNTRRILVGRTGTGKTALLLKIRNNEEHSIWIDPEDLSLQFLSNSTIIRYLHQLGVQLEIFYKLLWKHVFAVELIREKFDIRTEADKKNWLSRMLEQLFGDKRKEEALKYLSDWGQSFWKDTDYRIKEVTKKFEADVEASLGIDIEAFRAGASGKKTLSTEERADVVQRAQEVVNSIQIQQLTRVLKLLAREYFNSPQPRYYLLIDRLDEDWVDDSMRYRLIKALIEAVRDFMPIKSAKVIVSLRRDLLDRVIRRTRSPGFQEEKYEPLILDVHWTKEQLLGLP